MTETPDRKPRPSENVSLQVRVLSALIAAVCVLNLTAVGLSWWQSNRTNERQDEARAQARGTSCRDANDVRLAHNRLVLDIAGFDPGTGEPARFAELPADEQARLLPRVVRNILPLRVCTADAIEAFTASDRVEGVVPVDPADGFAEAVTLP